MPERSLSPQRLAYLRAQKRRRRVVLALQVLLLAAFLGWWELAARCGWVDAFIVSSPSRVVRTLAALQSSGELWLHIGTSCLEVVAGFLLGTLLGTLIAIGLWWSELLSRVLDPYLVVLNALPKTALGPVFIVWIGAGTGSIIAAYPEAAETVGAYAAAANLMTSVLGIYFALFISLPVTVKIYELVTGDKRAA